MKFPTIKIILLLISFSVSYTSINAQSNDSASLLNYLRGMINQNGEIKFEKVSKFEIVIVEDIDAGKFMRIPSYTPYSFQIEEKVLASTSIESQENVYQVPLIHIEYNLEGSVIKETPCAISFQKNGSEWTIVNISEKDNNWKTVDGYWSIAP